MCRVTMLRLESGHIGRTRAEQNRSTTTNGTFCRLKISTEMAIKPRRNRVLSVLSPLCEMSDGRFT